MKPHYRWSWRRKLPMHIGWWINGLLYYTPDYWAYRTSAEFGHTDS